MSTDAIIVDDFEYGKVVRMKSRALAVQYQTGSEPCAIAIPAAQGLIPEVRPDRTVVADGVSHFNTALQTVRGTGLARFHDVRLLNDYLVANGLDPMIKLAADYGFENHSGLNEALMTVVLAGKRYPAMISCTIMNATPAIWDCGGVALCGDWYGFPSRERAMAALLELPADCTLVRL